MLPRPQNKNVIGIKLEFKNKVNENGELVKNKAQLVFKLYFQHKVIYFKKHLQLWLVVKPLECS